MAEIPWNKNFDKNKNISENNNTAEKVNQKTKESSDNVDTVKNLWEKLNISKKSEKSNNKDKKQEESKEKEKKDSALVGKLKGFWVNLNSEQAKLIDSNAKAINDIEKSWKLKDFAKDLSGAIEFLDQDILDATIEPYKIKKERTEKDNKAAEKVEEDRRGEVKENTEKQENIVEKNFNQVRNSLSSTSLWKKFDEIVKKFEWATNSNDIKELTQQALNFLRNRGTQKTIYNEIKDNKPALENYKIALKNTDTQAYRTFLTFESPNQTVENVSNTLKVASGENTSLENFKKDSDGTVSYANEKTWMTTSVDFDWNRAIQLNNSEYKLDANFDNTKELDNMNKAQKTLNSSKNAVEGAKTVLEKIFEFKDEKDFAQKKADMLWANNSDFFEKFWEQGKEIKKIIENSNSYASLKDSLSQYQNKNEKIVSKQENKNDLLKNQT